MKIYPLIIILLLTLPFPSRAYSPDRYAAARQELVRQIESHVQATRAYIDKEALDPRVMAAMGAVPRHLFVPPGLQESAYDNRPLAIGYGQTISQPYIVALMTDLLGVLPASKVLEVGTGSAYQAAILAWLGAEVYSLEIIEPLAKEAKERVRRLAIASIHTRAGDGYYGWVEHAPYDAIIVTAAASHVPPPLISQLKVGGRMIIPVGSGFHTQQLLLITKENDGSLTTRQILPVVFVPLTGGSSTPP
ncbi:MAG: protein-L-isoaspartate(D-aspartate) O-methyltransferase [Desulforhopalus sp.]|nr:protein-L-isoaspartate(D-aspartate) O-methyltransferase [Desulforhopalus sp.]